MITQQQGCKRTRYISVIRYYLPLNNTYGLYNKLYIYKYHPTSLNSGINQEFRNVHTQATKSCKNKENIIQLLASLKSYICRIISIHH